MEGGGGGWAGGLCMGYRVRKSGVRGREEEEEERGGHSG